MQRWLFRLELEMLSHDRSEDNPMKKIENDNKMTLLTKNRQWHQNDAANPISGISCVTKMRRIIRKANIIYEQSCEKMFSFSMGDHLVCKFKPLLEANFFYKSLSVP